MDIAAVVGRRDDVVAAFQADVVASCVGPVTAAAFEMWGVPTISPERSRTAAMIKQLESELPLRRDGLAIEVAGHARSEEHKSELQYLMRISYAGFFLTNKTHRADKIS